MPTGDIEVVAADLLLLNEAKTPPFPIADDVAITNEEIRLKYRYLDLRRPGGCSATSSCATTSRAPSASTFPAADFLEIETPLLTRSTPEGARDYLVPEPRAPPATSSRCRSRRKYSSSCS